MNPHRRSAADGSALEDAPGLADNPVPTSKAEAGVPRHLAAANAALVERQQRHIRGRQKRELLAIVDEARTVAVKVVHSTIKFTPHQKLFSQRLYALAVEHGVRLRNVHASLYSVTMAVIDLLRGAELTKAESNEIAAAARKAISPRDVVKT